MTGVQTCALPILSIITLFGIEVPNSKGVKVPIRVMIDSDEFWQAKGALTFVVGIDIAGRKVMADRKSVV